MDVVLLFPGQGSQKPGMGKDLAEAFAGARAVFERADDALGTNLSRLCFDGPAEELTLTHNAQPALLAHGAAVWAITRDVIGRQRHGGGGTLAGRAHGVPRRDIAHPRGCGPGRAAAWRAHVRERDRAPGRDGRDPRRDRPSDRGDLRGSYPQDAGLVVPANYNAPGQVVVSGEEAGVERAMVLCREAGAKRAMRLKVSGAFHSPLMERVVPGLAQALEKASFDDPHFAVYANVNAEAVLTAARGKELLLEQLSKPVQWTEEIRALARRFPDALYVEMGPGNVLSGLVRKIAPSVKTAVCGTVADVRQLRALAAA